MDLQEYQQVVGSISEEFAATELDVSLLFPYSIKKMNEMYSVPVNQYPSLDTLGEPPVKRMTGFLKTLGEEMEEGLEIKFAMHILDWSKDANDLAEDAVDAYGFLLNYSLDDLKTSFMSFTGLYQEADVPTSFLQSMIDAIHDEEIGDSPTERLNRFILVGVADWLGDMVVYIRSEAMKYGIPLESVLACIMGSNFTKLADDGSVIKNENGKVIKGPNFVPPERHIYATLFEGDSLYNEVCELQYLNDNVQAIAAPVLLDPISDIFAEPEEDSSVELF